MNTAVDYILKGETWLVITTLFYFLMNGAQIFETAVIVPKWSASPPESFQMLRGKHGIDLKTFWIVMHSIHEITLLIALVLCWRVDSIRPWLIILLCIHFAVRIWTLLYFAPMIIAIQNKVNDYRTDMDLRHQVARWRKLNYIRVGVFIAVSLALIPLCVAIL